ncbi:hypothetical protein ASU32_00080 [Tsukamurella tyrosinosolvens]|nr:hypothetical protein ASU32_00080 [Tsukamurella tyrosinosolvens]
MRVLPAGGADEMICHLPQPFLTIWCDAPQVVVRDIPDGAAILLRQGDPIRVRGKETDRVCTVSLFARTPSGREWAITGDQCAETVGQSVYTFGGYRIGTVGAFLAPPAASSEPSFRMPAIRLDSRLLIQSTVTGSAAASERLVVRVDGGNVQSEREVYDGGRKLGGTLRSTFPMPQAGDRGAPAIADDRLVGVLRSAGDVTPASAVIQSLPGLDPTATLVVVR